MRNVCAKYVVTVFVLSVLSLNGPLLLCPAHAVELIDPVTDIWQLVGNESGSGNGTLDVQMFTTNTNDNKGSGLDFDDTNNGFPGGNQTTWFGGAYIISWGEIRLFFQTNFPDPTDPNLTTAKTLGITLDVNETGAPQTIQFDAFTIYAWDQAAGPLFTTPDDRNDPANIDLEEAVQVTTTIGELTAATKLAEIDGAYFIAAMTNQGGGWGDAIVDTHLPLFDNGYSGDDLFILWVASSLHDNGQDAVYLSGSVSHEDIIPEPATLSLLLLGLSTGLLRRPRRHEA